MSTHGISPESLQHQKLHYYEDKSPSVIAGSVVLIAVASSAVFLRLVSRRITGASWRSDDYTIVAALVFAYGLFVTMILGAHYGLGKHVIRVGLYNTTQMLKEVYALEAIFPACTATTKISILLLYRRIFTAQSMHFRISLYVLGALIVSWAVAGLFSTIFSCTPVHFFWDRVPPGHCINVQGSLVALATINTLLNITVLILPMPMIWRLNMPRRQKIGVCGIFVLGSLDIISAIFRTYMMSKVTVGAQDITMNDVDPGMLAFTEPCVGIMCACLPAMWSLFRSLHGRSTHGSSGKRSKSSYNSSGRSWPRSHKLHNSDHLAQYGKGTPATSANDSVMENDFLPLNTYGKPRSPPQDKSWLDPPTNARLRNEIYRTVSKEGNDVPSNGINVKSDVEWSASQKV